MLTLGRACLTLGLVLAVYGAAASALGGRRGDARLTASGRRALYALAALMVLAFALLESAFVRSDFSVAVVAHHSSTTTPLFYRATAIWSSQEGSLLLWVMLMSLWASLAVRVAAPRLAAVTPYATAILLVFAGFFLSLAVFWANPFQLLEPAPPEGAGLEPLLRHPSMMFHPPMLYSGYTLSCVPLAFAAAALLARSTDGAWVRAVRRFALGAWVVLAIGILLGARWSWTELGWGGYWAWDPVENAALMPWLTGTALLHSLMLQQRRGVLKGWNVSLALATGILAVLGTFLVRSGVLSSIHAFGASTLGLPFLGFIGLLVIGSVWLVCSRASMLAPERATGPLLARPAVFVANNVLLVGLCFVVAWGTFFPLVSEAATGHKASVGPPWFDRYTVPLALALVGLSGLGTLLRWGAQPRRRVARALAGPLAVAVAVVAVGLAAGGERSVKSLLLFAGAGFVAAASASRLAVAVRARRRGTGEAVPVAAARVVARHRRRYGGYLAHVGMAAALVGVAGSSAFQHVRDVRLKPGQSTHVGAYDVSYRRATGELSGEKISLGAVLDISRGGRHVATLHPTRGYYPDLSLTAGPISRYFDGESTSEVGLRAGVRRDVWMALEPDVGPLQRLMADADKRFIGAAPNVQALVVAGLVAHYEARPGTAVFRMIVSPLVEWIWLGGGLMVLGGLVAICPRLALRPFALRLPRPVRAVPSS